MFLFSSCNSCFCTFAGVSRKQKQSWGGYITTTILLMCGRITDFSGNWSFNAKMAHWGPMTHICISNLTIIGSDNALSPGQCQAMIWTNDGILLIWPLRTNSSEILIEIHTFSFKKMHFETLSGKWRPFCLSLKCVNSIISACTLCLNASQFRYTVRGKLLMSLLLLSYYILYFDG